MIYHEVFLTGVPGPGFFKHLGSSIKHVPGVVTAAIM